MLKFEIIDVTKSFDNSYILLYDYYHYVTNNSDNNLSFYKDIPLKKDKAIAMRIDDIYNSIYSIGEELYEYISNDEHFNMEFNFYEKNNFKYIPGIEQVIDDWVKKNGYPYFTGFEYFRKRKINKFSFNINLFCKDTMNLYILSRTHEIIHELEALGFREKNYDNQYDKEIKTLLEELNQLSGWFWSYGIFILKRIHQTCAIETSKEWLSEMNLIYNKEGDKYKINLEFLMPVVTQNKVSSEDNYFVDISLLDNIIDMDNFEEVSKTIKGLSILYTYKLKNYVNGQELYYPFEMSNTYSQNFRIDYEQIVFDKDIEIYKNFIMGYSLIGISYYKLLLNLTTDFSYGGSEMLKCANPNCKNYFQKKTNKKYCDNKECQKYRKNKKSNDYYKRNKTKSEKKTE